ncbi:thrombospondin type 3 repeat-containing protein [Glaciecola sp. SC05]|uniref:thrombospondin type 3 repeat-containing protein n=1 Tax=Glaciecola sp. SC05 TaxID=1987355 RepID=UPI003528A5D9
MALLLSVSIIGCGGSDSAGPPVIVTQAPDADSDGVNDAQDTCANTSANATVDSNGCAPTQLDNDDDGKNNAIDQCPATPQGEAVDILGCGIDTQGGASPDDLDNDSVLNANDSCDATPRDELVDAVGCSASQKDNDADGVSDDIDVCDTTPNGEPVDIRGCGINSETQVLSSAFVERDGLLVIELESTNYDGDWQLRTGRLSSGNAYLMYQGNNNFNLPGVDVITVPIVINQPGIYRFSWLNIIGEGDSPTEANDSWLQINSENFYAKKISNAQGDTPLGHIVCPVGRPSSNRCEGEAPEGSSSQGWLKVYRTGSPVDDWVWRSFTSDNDPHAIFAEFDQAGQYNILISGRSFGHGIDRLVLYRSENPNSNVSEETAISLDRAESSRE